MSKRFLMAGLAAAGIAAGGLFALNAVEEPRAVAAQPVSGDFSYQEYAELLSAYVDDKGRVDYKGLKANRQPLDRFTAQMGGLSPSVFDAWPEKDRLAFWINAYNAFTLKAIVDHYPIQKGGFLSAFRYPANSIRQISGVWNKLEWRVLGKQVTLNHIEHEILRKEFSEPRVHMVIVCASVGCPLLHHEPFVAERLDAQLDEQTRGFLAVRDKFRIDRGAKRVYLSPIFDWFGDDFEKKYSPPEGFGRLGKTEKAVLNFVSGYVNDADKQYLEAGAYKAGYLDYDWSLNEQ